MRRLSDANEDHILYKRTTKGTMYFNGKKWTHDRSEAEKHSEAEAERLAREINQKANFHPSEWLNVVRFTRV